MQKLRSLHLNFEGRARAIAYHYWQKLLINSLGRFCVTPTGKRIRSFIGSFGSQTPRPKINVAIVSHIYYVDLVHEIIQLREIFPDVVSLHLTVPTDRLNDLSTAVANYPKVTLHPYENRGRDIAPFMQLIGSGALDAYDAVLKVHTKRSPHLIDGDLRRKLLFAMLCGERNSTFKAIKSFESPDTGLVGWSYCYRTDPIFWMANRAAALSLSERMNATKFMKLGFFEGSMFWFRPSSLSALRQLDLAIEDFEPEAGQLDGTLHHAIERCFTIAARSKGFKILDLEGREL